MVGPIHDKYNMVTRICMVMTYGLKTLWLLNFRTLVERQHRILSLARHITSSDLVVPNKTIERKRRLECKHYHRCFLYITFLSLAVILIIQFQLLKPRTKCVLNVVYLTINKRILTRSCRWNWVLLKNNAQHVGERSYMYILREIACHVYKEVFCQPIASKQQVHFSFIFFLFWLRKQQVLL